jgi:very-short-patch-repair endonuclease
VNSLIKVDILCKTHGLFKQTPITHLSGCGCPTCARYSINRKKLNTQKFIDKANKVHNGKYDYSNVLYQGSFIKISVKCPKHGMFLQTPSAHLFGAGCPICLESHGERNIYRFLKENNIFFKPEHQFDTCVYKKRLFFDFYLPDRKICIEYDGLQHFKPIKYFGGLVAFKKLVECDRIKTEFCKKSGIGLIRLNYKMKSYQIFDYLKNELIKPSMQV